MSFAGDAGARPPRVSLTNLRSGETVEMPFMPEELVESIAVKWTRLAIMGMSHETLQYTGTGNYNLPGLEFYFRGTSVEEVDAINDGRKFLLSLAYAPEGAEGLRDGAPARILFYWPRVVSMSCQLMNIQITHQKFNRVGQSTIFRARFDLEEARDIRIAMEDVRFRIE